MQRLRIPRALLACASLVGICASLGCETPIAYPGPRRPPSEVARLTCDGSIRILGVDGREFSTRELEILPGAHRVDLKVVFRSEELGGNFANTDMRRSCRADAKFIAEPGVNYRLIKLSKKRGVIRKPTERTKTYYDHDFGVLLIDEQLGDVIPDAVSDLNCG